MKNKNGKNKNAKPSGEHPFMEAASRNLRALKLWHGLCPCLLPSILLSSAFTALSPYMTIWLSARLVDELAGLRRPQTLLTLALAELLSAALLALAAGALKRWKNAEMDASGQKEEELYMEKLFRLDYADLDDQATYKLYSRIRQSTQWSSWVRAVSGACLRIPSPRSCGFWAAFSCPSACLLPPFPAPPPFPG